MKDFVIEVNNLSKAFGDKKAVDGLSFSVEKGGLFAFLGQNGAGKSTTINMLIGLLNKDGGGIIYEGGRSFEAFKPKIGVVFQSNILDDKLTVGENLALYCSLYYKNKQEMKKRLKETAETFALKDVMKKKFGVLSGGQKRKAELARALLSMPEILFLDEPTTGLDPRTRMEVWSILNKVREKRGTTLFLTTHYMEETAEADKVVIIHKGKKVCEGSPSELKAKYSNDRLIIVPHNSQELEKELAKNNTAYEKVADSYVIQVGSAAESIETLSLYKNNIRFFEAKKGAMDDVFLNVVGESISGEDKI